MAVKKVSRENFIQLISDFLKKTNLGFKEEKDCWILERNTPSGTDRFAINGKLVEARREEQTVQFRIEVVGQGEIKTAGVPDSEDEFLQVRFSVQSNGQTVREIEDCIYMQDSLDQFKCTFMEIFR